MKITQISAHEYDVIQKNLCSVFDSSPFCELNKHKADEVAYLLFNDGKNRFVAVVGIRERVLKIPFSASFSMLNEASKHNKIICYHEAVKELDQWATEKGCDKIVFSLPPHFYNPSALSMFYNALFVNGYKTEDIEVNFEYYLKDFSDSYEMSIDPKARQKLRAAIKNGLSFEKTDDLHTVYEIIRKNRQYRGFPLWMSQKEIENTHSVVNMDFFLVRNFHQTPVASALVYHINDTVLRVIYWGNTPESENLRPMNFLAYHVFKFYSNSQFQVIDIGHSTDKSIPNFGLCDFKQAIGCACSPKFIMVKDLLSAKSRTDV